MSRTKVFISYSHEDERWRKRVTSQLAVLDSEGLINLWDDRKIGAGDDWFRQLDHEILNARIAVLLISSAFLTSEFIRKKEIPALFDRHGQNGMTIYPLLIRDCPWQEVKWLAKMQLRPPGTKPVAAYRGSKVDEVLAGVAREIGSIVRAQAPYSKQTAIRKTPINMRSQGLAWLETKGTHRDELTKVSRYYTSEIARSGVPGWWFEFPETNFSADPNGYINLLCQSEKEPHSFYHFRIPNSYFAKHKRELAFRRDRRMYSLHLSGEAGRKFQDVRGSGKVDFSSFLV